VRLLGVAGAMVFTLSGCATGANQAAEVPPAPANYRAQIVAKLKATLKDPYSVREPQISEPAPMWAGLLRGGTGMAVCVRLNAKNSFGAYTGLQNHKFIFVDGAPLEVPDAAGNCKNVSFSPLPELESAPAQAKNH
jgi:hypothetical protein